MLINIKSQNNQLPIYSVLQIIFLAFQNATIASTAELVIACVNVDRVIVECSFALHFILIYMLAVLFLYSDL